MTDESPDKRAAERGAAQHTRRGFVSSLATGALAMAMTRMGVADAGRDTSAGSFGPPPRVRQINAGVLSVGYYEVGPVDGVPVLLLHGFPYAIDSYREVAPILAAGGCRVIVPHLRGHGSTRFLADDVPRSGQQAAIGADVVALMDALGIRSAVLAGYDWGGRAACVVAALWPERCSGLVSVNGYLIQDIARAGSPLTPAIESGLWYQYYFTTERGRIGLAAHRRELARVLWTRNSPRWRFDDETFARSAEVFGNSDYVDVVIHSYRHRLGLVKGYPAYESLEQRLATLPIITVPTITLDGDADGVVPSTNGTGFAGRFSGAHTHRILRGVGHNPPQEAPKAFAGVVSELVALTR